MRLIQLVGKKIASSPRISAIAGVCLLLISIGVAGRVINYQETRRLGDEAQPMPPAVASVAPHGLAGYHIPDKVSADAASLRSAMRAGLEDSSLEKVRKLRVGLVDGIYRTAGNCDDCDLGVALAAVALGSVESDPKIIKLAIKTIDVKIQEDILPNGAFRSSTAGEGPDIQTTAVAEHIGLALYILGPELDDAHRASWTEALRGATEFLISNGNYDWYTNGNIVLGNAAVAALTWQATGDARYRAIYKKAIRFAEYPPADRWPGRGLIITKKASDRNGTGEEGYLTEQAGDGKPGFDADYTQVQADLAAIAAMVTGDAEAYRLTNLLVNRLLPRVDRTSWQLDTSGGSRRPNQGRVVPFTTAALVILANRGRSDLSPLVAAQSKEISRYMMQNSGDYVYWGTRMTSAVIAMK